SASGSNGKKKVPEPPNVPQCSQCEDSNTCLLVFLNGVKFSVERFVSFAVFFSLFITFKCLSQGVFLPGRRYRRANASIRGHTEGFLSLRTPTQPSCICVHS
ncbi:unnamed protein product, partial [Ectocarpus sp. 8 AP-2014]